MSKYSDARQIAAEINQDAERYALRARLTDTERQLEDEKQAHGATMTCREKAQAEVDRLTFIVNDTERQLREAQERCERLEESNKQLRERRERIYDDMLEWRGIDREMGDEPCRGCGGSGVKAYGDTSTWRGGWGGQAITNDICDECWGSGNAKKPWLDLRNVQARAALNTKAKEE